MRRLWDQFLMFNLLFLGISFLWFVALVLGRYALNIDLGWNIWPQAWTWVINPSLGIFFMGVLISWLQSKFLPRTK